MGERAAVSEYVYAIDFVKKNAYNILKPETQRLFSVNRGGFDPPKIVSML